MDAIRLIDAGEVSAVRSQALYHGLAAAMTESSPDTIVLCRPSEAYFSIGYHQEPESELDLDFCRQHGYPVLHRKIGGGAVVLDRDQLFYQVILPASRAPLRVESIYEKFLAAPVATLRDFGIPATLEGTNEVEARGRRIAGTGGGRVAEAMVMTGNFLFDFPYELMTRSWRTPSAAFRDLAGKALRRSVTTIRKEIGFVPPIDEIKQRLVENYRRTLGRRVVAGELTPGETAAVIAAEAEVLDPSIEGPLVRAERVLKIARGVYVRQSEQGPMIEECR